MDVLDERIKAVKQSTAVSQMVVAMCFLTQLRRRLPRRSKGEEAAHATVSDRVGRPGYILLFSGRHVSSHCSLSRVLERAFDSREALLDDDEAAALYHLEVEAKV